jgi:hypothetical protein
VRIYYRRNDDPASQGCQPETIGYPVCTATVERPLRGYDSLMGWIQLVRSDDNVSRGEHFAIDPLAFLGDLPHPYCWLGLNPAFFDAPSRSPRVDTDWMAHSFLCVPDDVGDGLEARPLLGFSWGFVARDGEVMLVAPEVLDGAAWDQHRNTLRGQHPGWLFRPGLTDLA